MGFFCIEGVFGFFVLCLMVFGKVVGGGQKFVIVVVGCFGLNVEECVFGVVFVCILGGFMRFFVHVDDVLFVVVMLGVVVVGILIGDLYC